ncbi:MAG: GNAT family N-acetyltransferase, partial [Caldilineaceae bacterium]|nr:GNAT family N-acetyltransferase [Caldilineaceae bacterium]
QMDEQFPIVVRPVQQDDAIALQANCFSANTIAQIEEALAKTITAMQAGKELQLVALVKEQVVGSATLIRDSHALRSHRAGLFGLVVHPDYQRRGVAHRLVDALLAHAQTLGIEILETSCRAGTGAEQLYPKLGFTEYGRLPGGLYQRWSEPTVFDEVYFYRECECKS